MDAPERHVLIDLRDLSITEIHKLLPVVGLREWEGASAIVTDNAGMYWYWDLQWGHISSFRLPYRGGTPGRDYEYISGREILWN